MSKRLRVGILFGGRSGEHQVSLMSAASVWKAIDRERFEPVPIGITLEGRWLVPESFEEAVSTPALGENGHRVLLMPEPGFSSLRPLEDSGGVSEWISSRLDVVFPVLHGPLGEDGTVQGLFELADVPYVGAGVAASAVGMDKVLMKRLFEARDLPICRFLAFRRSRWEREPDRVRGRCRDELGFPCFVKPANLGSSVGISKVNGPGGLDAAIDLACRYDRKFMVEKAVRGRELEVSVLGNENPRASVPGEVRPKREFYDYRAKYSEGESELIVPAELSRETSGRLRQLAVEAFRAIDAEGLARVDFFMAESGEILVNEINTMPGFTHVSMYPRLWEKTGLGYSELLTRLIELGLERHRERARNQTTYDPEEGSQKE